MVTEKKIYPQKFCRLIVMVKSVRVKGKKRKGKDANRMRLYPFRKDICSGTFGKSLKLLAYRDILRILQKF